MKLAPYLSCLILFAFSVSKVQAQETNVNKKEVESINGMFAFQVGLPTNQMQEAIQNKMGNAGFGGALIILTNPAAWGKNKKNSPIRLGVEAGYTYYGRFITDVDVNGYHGDFKTSYGIIQLNGVLQVRPRVAEKVTPFFELLAGGSFYISTIKENFGAIEAALGMENIDLETYSSSGFNKGIAIGCYIGKQQKPGAAKLALRLSYNRSGDINYIVRNSVVYDPPGNQFSYEVGETQANYFMVQIGVGF
jgi:hypothetical protein